jgi:hypothetical protein
MTYNPHTDHTTKLDAALLLGETFHAIRMVFSVSDPEVTLGESETPAQPAEEPWETQDRVRTERSVDRMTGMYL